MNPGEPRRPTLRYERAGREALPHSAAVEGSRKRKVLVIDDDRDMVRLLGALLESDGFFVVAAFDSMQGLVVAQREQPALIVTDLKMPAGGGVSLMGRLKGNPRTQAIPVLVVSAAQEEGLDTALVAKGATGFLPKPLDPTAFLEAVHGILRAQPSDAAGTSRPAS